MAMHAGPRTGGPSDRGALGQGGLGCGGLGYGGKEICGFQGADRMSKGEPYSQTIAVIGGGIAGITAAVETAETGYDVCSSKRAPRSAAGSPG